MAQSEAIEETTQKKRSTCMGQLQQIIPEQVTENMVKCMCMGDGKQRSLFEGRDSRA